MAEADITKDLEPVTLFACFRAELIKRGCNPIAAEHQAYKAMRDPLNRIQAQCMLLSAGYEAWQLNYD